jgi:hypothetical protein
MAEYISEGEAPVLMIRLLRDSDNFELLQMVLEGRAGRGQVAALSKKVVKNLLSVDPPKNGESVFFIQKLIVDNLIVFNQNVVLNCYRRVRSLFKEI